MGGCPAEKGFAFNPFQEEDAAAAAAEAANYAFINGDSARSAVELIGTSANGIQANEAPKAPSIVSAIAGNNISADTASWLRRLLHPLLAGNLRRSHLISTHPTPPANTSFHRPLPAWQDKHTAVHSIAAVMKATAAGLEVSMGQAAAVQMPYTRSNLLNHPSLPPNPFPPNHPLSHSTLRQDQRGGTFQLQGFEYQRRATQKCPRFPCSRCVVPPLQMPVAILRTSVVQYWVRQSIQARLVRTSHHPSESACLAWRCTTADGTTYCHLRLSECRQPSSAVSVCLTYDFVFQDAMGDSCRRPHARRLYANFGWLRRERRAVVSCSSKDRRLLGARQDGAASGWGELPVCAQGGAIGASDHRVSPLFVLTQLLLGRRSTTRFCVGGK